MPKILIIDDEETVRFFLRDFFEDRDFDVELAGDGAEGLAKFTQGSYDLVLCDFLMPKMLGIQFLAKARELKPAQRVIMLTGVKEASLVEKAEKLGCHFYLQKPIRLAELEAKTKEALADKS